MEAARTIVVKTANFFLAEDVSTSYICIRTIFFLVVSWDEGKLTAEVWGPFLVSPTPTVPPVPPYGIQKRQK